MRHGAMSVVRRSHFRRFGLVAAAISLGATPAVFSLLRFRPASIESDDPRGTVLAAWLVASLLAILVGVFAFLQSVHLRSGKRTLSFALVGTVMGFVGLAGFIDVNRYAGHVWLRGRTRVKCERMLQGDVWVALRQFAQNHSGRLPDRFSELYEHGLVDFWTMRCPARRDPLSREQIAASLDDPEHIGNTFVYVGAGLQVLTDRDPVPILYEHLKNHETGIHVLYTDGSVRWVPAASIRDFTIRAEKRSR